MDERVARQLGAPSAKGVLVYRLSADSDAYAAGVRRYDIIVSFNGKPVDDASQFMRQLSNSAIGSTATLGLLRDGRTITAKVPIVQTAGGRRSR